MYGPPGPAREMGRPGIQPDGGTAPRGQIMLTIEIFLLGILPAVSTAICGDVRKTSERVIYHDGNGMP